MTLLVMPTLSCNIGCVYCFQRPVLDRPSKHIVYKPDLEAMKQSILNIIKTTGHTEIVLHGGEPLLTPIKDLQDILEWATRHNLKVAVQTNGILITEQHIQLFKRYNVSVGISIDGLENTNVLRGYHEHGYNPETKVNQLYRKRMIKIIERLARETTDNGQPILGGVITIIHKINAKENIEELAKFIEWLWNLGVKSGRLNPMYANTEYAKQFELTPDELYEAYVYLWERLKHKVRNWTPYTDIINLLLGDFKNTVCWFNGCSYYDSFVWTVLPDGTVISCDRAMDRGLWTRATLPQTRPRALWQAMRHKYKYPHLHLFGCPAEAEDHWMNPSKFTPAFEKLIDYMAQQIKTLFPWYKLTTDYPDPEKLLEYRFKGCQYDYINGEFTCNT